jgi:hypothetical protein
VTRRALPALGALVVVAVGLAACGKKGDPLPPLQIAPAAISDLTAAVSAGEVTLAFTVPAANPDDETIVAPERIEIYRVDAAEAGKMPDLASAIGEKPYLRGEIAIRAPDAPAPAGDALPPPAPGERATFVEAIDPAANVPSRTYAAVGVVGRNRRGPLATVTVPLGTLPTAPETVSATHDERSLVLSWSGDGKAFRVFGLQDATATDGALLTPTPVTEPRFTMPVEFGRERCFVVRTVLVAGAATVEGPPSAAACITPVDQYPPPAPTGLQAIQEGTAITLTWNPSPVPDLAGYVVLRGDATGIDMQPLVKTPVREPTYRDETAQAGATYTYSVYAVDNASTPNVSQQSERQVVAVR